MVIAFSTIRQSDPSKSDNGEKRKSTSQSHGEASLHTQPMNLHVIVRRLLSNCMLGARGSCKETAIKRCFLQRDVVIFQRSLDLIVIDYWLKSSKRILSWRWMPHLQNPWFFMMSFVWVSYPLTWSAQAQTFTFYQQDKLSSRTCQSQAARCNKQQDHEHYTIKEEHEQHHDHRPTVPFRHAHSKKHKPCS